MNEYKLEVTVFDEDGEIDIEAVDNLAYKFIVAVEELGLSWALRTGPPDET